MILTILIFLELRTPEAGYRPQMMVIVAVLIYSILQDGCCDFVYIAVIAIAKIRKFFPHESADPLHFVSRIAVVMHDCILDNSHVQRLRKPRNFILTKAVRLNDTRKNSVSKNPACSKFFPSDKYCRPGEGKCMLCNFCTFFIIIFYFYFFD